METECDCGNPQCRGRPSNAWVRTQIETTGNAVICVLRDDDDGPSFAYTIGLHDAGKPELLMIGGDMAERLPEPLNALAKIARGRDAPFATGELVHLPGGKFPVRIVDVVIGDVAEEYTAVVGHFYGTDAYRVQQAQIPDREGRYPGDPDCAEPYASFRIRF